MQSQTLELAEYYLRSIDTRAKNVIIASTRRRSTWKSHHLTLFLYSAPIPSMIVDFGIVFTSRHVDEARYEVEDYENIPTAVNSLLTG